jgi:hypothetical protein
VSNISLVVSPPFSGILEIGLVLNYFPSLLNLTITAIDSVMMNRGRMVNQETSGTEGVGELLGVGYGCRYS